MNRNLIISVLINSPGHIASIRDIGKETVGRVFKIIGNFIYRKFIEAGLSKGDFPIDIGIFPESTKEPIDSDWSIKVSSRVDRPIEKCHVLLNKEELQWANKKGRKVIVIPSHGGENVRIPKELSTDYARVQIWDSKNIKEYQI